MTELLTAAQMRAIEQAAIASGEVTGLELMERAGRGVVEVIFEEWPELRATSHRAVVLCGPGNNGGDGFVVARLLKEWGWEVEVFLYGDASKLPPDARVNYERWGALGEVHVWDDSYIEDRLDSFEHQLVIDALFGTGLVRPMPEDTERTWHGFMPSVFNYVSQGRAPRYVAVDMPSGICSDSGKNLEGAFPANLTITFHSPKIGHFLSGEVGGVCGGADWCGKVRTVDIGLKTVSSKEVTELRRVPSDFRYSLAFLGKGPASHKYTHGHALILSGGPGHGGAARLAARGALRIGAGLVTVACPAEALPENAAQLTAIMLQPVGDISDLIEVLVDDRINAVCTGPGLGLEDDARMVVTAVLAADRATVLDADALTAYEDDPSTLFDQLHERCVLTPHAGEFARLFPDIAEKLNATPTKGPAYSKVDATREAAARAGCVVLFKGPDTVIATPDGRCSINSSHYERAAPWLATAGSGDVLAGFITGLLARGFDPKQAAETGAWLHVECARKFGPGLIAEDLAEQLPRVFTEIEI